MIRRNWLLSCLALFVCGVLFTPNQADAQAGQVLFDYQLKNRAQTDQGSPLLILRAREYIKSGKVKFERGDGKTYSSNIGKMKPGQEKKIKFRQPKGGIYKYKLIIDGVTKFDQTVTMSLETDVAWVDPIKLKVDPDSVRVAEGELIMGTNVHLERVQIEVFDAGGSEIANISQPLGNKRGNLKVKWPAKGGDVGAIRLTAYDIAGFWAGVILEPFWVDIPHDDIVFDNGKATWQAPETPKLKATLKLIKDAMAKHKSKGLKMSMYVAGYTDTVGGGSDNIKLSRARARSIGKWFRQNGLKVDIYYQGFGESVLAVSTPDNSPEPRNRRAIYVLGNAPPPTSKEIPRSNWKRL